MTGLSQLIFPFKIMPFVEFVAGWISGALGIMVGHPLDTVKVRIQTQVQYKGIIDCIARTYKNEKIWGFFKGMSYPVLSTALCNSVLFGSYSNATHYLRIYREQDGTATLSNFDVFLSGCFGGLVQVLVSAPVDLVKVRLQNQTHHYKHHLVAGGTPPRYKGPLHCTVIILKEEGVKGLYRGALALTLRDVPTCGIYFTTYKLLCRAMTEKDKDPDTLTTLVAGGMTGIFSWTAATPMDVIKARMQMDGIEKVKYRSVFDCILTSIKQEGVWVLCKGMTVNCVRAFPVNAVTFLSFEELMKIMGSRSHFGI
ncbi:solute carrier family 25 member 45-like isoform X1 [Protopterus annectens]|uniref:solute carrier family 25 member 45-like isoform X1 n=2 Tax=Protopterus annectens TaxID=7888 RepID=UPI001CFB7767|nr:solute carrier family 25 member 45-like isoform X1 [Protopterus annectens]